jgi:hypothetical protein
VRLVSLIPTAFVDYYYGGQLENEQIAEALAHIAADCVGRHLNEPWRVAKMAEEACELYKAASSRAVDLMGPRHPAHMLLGAVLAEAARYLRAGASLDEIQAVFGMRPDPAGSLTAGLEQKMSALETWELKQYSRAIGVGA